MCCHGRGESCWAWNLIAEVLASSGTVVAGGRGDAPYIDHSTRAKKLSITGSASAIIGKEQKLQGKDRRMARIASGLAGVESVGPAFEGIRCAGGRSRQRTDPAKLSTPFAPDRRSVHR